MKKNNVFKSILCMHIVQIKMLKVRVEVYENNI